MVEFCSIGSCFCVERSWETSGASWEAGSLLACGGVSIVNFSSIIIGSDDGGFSS